MNGEDTIIDGREQLFRWVPSSGTVKAALGAAAATAGVLGALGFGESFGSLMTVAYPFLGWACWILPVIIDLGILALTVLALVADLAGFPSRLIGLVPVGLSAWTLYLNTADVHSMVGKAVHAAGPAMWILVVEAGGVILRRLVGLSHRSPRIERIRRVLWLIRPLSTLRLWREMRIHQIPTYRAALDRDASRSAVTGRLRLVYGRRWKRTAPLSERIALTLLGRDPGGVRTALDAHTETAHLLGRADQDQTEQSAAATAEPTAEPGDTIADQPASAPVSAAPSAAYSRQVRRMRRIQRSRSNTTTPAPVPHVAPEAPKSAPKPRPRQVPNAGKLKRPAVLSDAELITEVGRMHRAALAESGGVRGTSNRAVQAALGVGHTRAKSALDAVRALAAEPAPAVFERVNGNLIAA